MDSLNLRIISPAGLLLDAMVERVSMFALDGSFGVEKGHVPLIASLKKSAVNYVINGERHSLDIPGGVAEVRDDRVLILTDPPQS